MSVMLFSSFFLGFTSVYFLTFLRQSAHMFFLFICSQLYSCSVLLVISNISLSFLFLTHKVALLQWLLIDKSDLCLQSGRSGIILSLCSSALILF